MVTLTISPPLPLRALGAGARTCVRAGALVAALVLAGCASGPLRVNTEVQAFSAPAGTAAPMQWQGARYRFDVLPSQSRLDLAPLQAMTQAALDRHGLVRDDASASLAVQVSASLRTAWVDDWGPGGWGPWGPWRPGWRFGLGYGYPGWGWGGAYMPPSTYLRELRVAIQNLSTGQTVYETRARNESPSGLNDAIFAAMLNAALKDFPNAAAGVQTVVTDVPTEPAPSARPTGTAPTPSAPATPALPAASAATNPR
ncbi:DUF4136 domain-containing protein [Comamonas serinivorans]|uniref:DUF4136 domain-containing protein n=1 Tax=Comamonas serinivorans TaxID=1082851 RepID=UPI0012F78CF4|nr:DUF4136 domain-containing protein [Comamonas serinivorans]